MRARSPTLTMSNSRISRSCSVRAASQSPSRQVRTRRAYPAGSTLPSPGTTPSAPIAIATSTSTSEPVSTEKPSRARSSRCLTSVPQACVVAARVLDTGDQAVGGEGEQHLRVELGVHRHRDVVGEDRDGESLAEEAEVALDLRRMGTRVERRRHHHGVTPDGDGDGGVLGDARRRHVDGPGEHRELSGDVGRPPRRAPRADEHRTGRRPHPSIRARTARRRRRRRDGRRAVPATACRCRARGVNGVQTGGITPRKRDGCRSSCGAPHSFPAAPDCQTS